MNEALPDNTDAVSRVVAMYDSLPKIAEDDPRVVAHLAGQQEFEVQQFQNNFYLLFWCLQRGQENVDEDYWESYAGQFLRHSQAQTVLETPTVQSLIGFFGSETWINYRAYSSAFIDTSNQLILEKPDNWRLRYEDMMQGCGGPLGMTRVEAAVWDPLNQMLVEAAGVMQTSGMDPSWH